MRLATGPARVCSRQEAERELKAAAALGIGFLALGEPDYPRRLAMIDDAPPLIAGMSPESYPWHSIAG